MQYMLLDMQHMLLDGYAAYAARYAALGCQEKTTFLKIN